MARDVLLFCGSAGQKIMGFAVVALWVPVFSIKGIEKQVTGQSSFVCAYLASKHDFEPVITKKIFFK